MQIGIGEWKMRNGNKATVVGKRIDQGCLFPWIGWHADCYSICWSDTGDSITHRLVGDKDASIIAPWTSPIAKGYNPDQLTEEQVGVSEGWRLLDRDEIKNRNHYPCHSWLRESQSWGEDCHAGAAIGFTYRTRLSREELAKLDKPKKRLIRVEELPPVCWIDMGNGKRRLANGYDLPEQKLVAGGNHVAILVAKDKGWQWSSDLKNWNSFEVEDK